MQLKPLSPGHCCPVCSEPVIGRSDKIYCSISCKNRHHASTRKMNYPVTEAINRRLKRNYTVLQGLMGRKHDTLKTTLLELSRRGFDPAHSTGAVLEGNSRLVFACYRFRYFIREDGVVFVYQNLEEVEVLPGVFERWEVEFDPDFVTNVRKGRERGWPDKLDPPKRE